MCVPPSTIPARAWSSYAALGDSFTEGLVDEVAADGRHVGWADRLAVELARRAEERGESGIRYANLAVRGRLTRQVVREQVPAAVRLQPQLASLAVGVNDTLRPRFDLDVVATALESGVRELRGSGADVLIFAFGDPVRRSLAMSGIRERIRGYNSAVHAIAGAYGCYVVDFWQVAAYDDDRLWDEDRLHLSPAGHRLAARTALDALGLGDGDWRTPEVPADRAPLHRRAGTHARWATGHLAPWVLRRVRRASSGDGIDPKFPAWVPSRRPASADRRRHPGRRRRLRVPKR